MSRLLVSRLPLSTLALACALLACRPASSGRTADSAGASPDSAVASLPADSVASTPGDSVAPAPADSVELRVDRNSYSATDTLHLTIANHSRGTYSFNPCTRMVERQTSSGWESLAEPDRICTMEAWLLAPDSTRTATTTLPHAIAPGTYRLALSLTREGESGRTTSRSGSFVVAK